MKGKHCHALTDQSHTCHRPSTIPPPRGQDGSDPWTAVSKRLLRWALCGSVGPRRDWRKDQNRRIKSFGWLAFCAALSALRKTGLFFGYSREGRSTCAFPPLLFSLRISALRSLPHRPGRTAVGDVNARLPTTPDVTGTAAGRRTVGQAARSGTIPTAIAVARRWRSPRSTQARRWSCATLSRCDRRIGVDSTVGGA